MLPLSQKPGDGADGVRALFTFHQSPITTTPAVPGAQSRHSRSFTARATRSRCAARAGS
jgi:hypothetical protein